MAAQLIKSIESEFTLRVSLREAHKYFCLSILPCLFLFLQVVSVTLQHNYTTSLAEEMGGAGTLLVSNSRSQGVLCDLLFPSHSAWGVPGSAVPSSWSWQEGGGVCVWSRALSGTRSKSS